MARLSAPYRKVSAFTFSLLLPITTHVAICQRPIPEPRAESGQELKLTPAEEKDTYQIYSLLLRTEMPPQWKITAWAIKQETQTFPSFAALNWGEVDSCLQVAKDQEPIHRPVIDDYVARNKKKLALKDKFDLPQYAFIRSFGDLRNLPFKAHVIFEVSAVGFNRDATRALVYVGHNCGSLCGGGQYHLMVKKNGQWEVDREYHGVSCIWKS